MRHGRSPAPATVRVPDSSQRLGRRRPSPVTEGGRPMRLSRWQHFNPVWNQLQNLQSEMNQLFDRWSEDGGRLLGLAGGFPPVNVWEDQEAVHVEAELPGLNLNDLEIYVTGGNQLTIKGERKQELPDKSVRHRQERAYGTFARVLTLPF